MHTTLHIMYGFENVFGVYLEDMDKSAIKKSSTNDTPTENSGHLFRLRNINFVTESVKTTQCH